ncbi:MAG: hypothetical protein LBQ01_09470, partial [Prevotellaceae bacterium]|nr:hypothetical protein [Prevotellaceae bacterium]
KEITLAFNSLEINNEYLRGVVLRYSEIEKQIEAERIAEEQRKEAKRIAERIAEEQRQEAERLAEEKRRKEHIDSFITERENKFYTYVASNKLDNTVKMEQAIKTVLENTDVRFNLPEFEITDKIFVNYNGDNKHDITINGLNNSELAAKLTAAINALTLEPEKAKEPYTRQDYPVNTQDTFRFNISIANYKVKAQKRFQSITIDEYVPQNLKNAVPEMMPYGGNYSISMNNLTVNGKSSINSLKVLKYRDTGTASNAFLSLLVPGLGVKRVTYGEHSGFRRTLYAYGLIGAGILCKTVANNEYKKYNAAPDKESDKMKELYEDAKILDKAYYICAGIGAAIWVYDIIWVWNKGSKNRQAHKAYKQPRFGIYYNPEFKATGLTYTVNF